jgi:Pyruvate/2-oxoacid:ferredoxin oxidoreductase gamma subunit
MSSGYETKTFAEIIRERNEELRRREAEQYEALLRERFKERYPNPTTEQKRKIEARVQKLMERHEATLGAGAMTEVSPLRRFEEQLQQRLAARFPELSPDQARRLHDRIAQAVEKQRERLVEARRPSLEETRSGSLRARGSVQREFYER